jgi:hypothetical protein
MVPDMKQACDVIVDLCVHRCMLFAPMHHSLLCAGGAAADADTCQGLGHHKSHGCG